MEPFFRYTRRDDKNYEGSQVAVMSEPYKFAGTPRAGGVVGERAARALASDELRGNPALRCFSYSFCSFFRFARVDSLSEYYPLRNGRYI